MSQVESSDGLLNYDSIRKPCHNGSIDIVSPQDEL